MPSKQPTRTPFFIATDDTYGTSARAKDIALLLADYSRCLGSGVTLYQASYTPAMLNLIKERHEFYAEYYETGLHLNLEVLKPSFYIEDSTSEQIGNNVTRITVSEMVTMYGHPIITEAEQYPLIMAGQWALAHTENKAVQEGLQNYLKYAIEGANESISQGVTISYPVQHVIDIVSQNGFLKIIRDEFTDKASDNGEGMDNVTWIDGNPVRKRPDFAAMLEYEIYHTPIEVLGQRLLDDYSKGY